MNRKEYYDMQVLHQRLFIADHPFEFHVGVVKSDPGGIELIRRLGSRILDIGCGQGAMIACYEDENQVVIGIDLDSESLKIASRNTSGVFLRLDAETLPFIDESFDLIIMNAVIEHIYDYRHCLQECYRVLEKKGNIIISNIPTTLNSSAHLHFFKKRDFRGVLTGIGFKCKGMKPGEVDAFSLLCKKEG